jgi:uridine kinase
MLIKRSGTRARVLEQIADQILAVERSHPVRVGIDGLSAAGKTTMADELVVPLARCKRPVIRASIDDFHRPAEERYRRGRFSPEGYYLDTFDYPAVRAALLLPLGPDGSRRYRTAVFDSWRDLPINAPVCDAAPNAILLCDGVFLFRPELNDLWDFRIFVDTDSDEAVRRGIRRDQEWIGSLEAAEERYRIRYVPGERIYLDRVHPHRHADVIVENTDPGNPRLTLRKHEDAAGAGTNCGSDPGGRAVTH